MYKDPYKSFLRVSRLMDLLLIKRWSGVALGIKSLLPTRAVGAMNVFCPSCPEPGVNMPMQVPSRPSDMRLVARSLLKRFSSLFSHTSSLRLTIDGNHHANRYAKNTDYHDTSLIKGESYMPTRAEYQEHLSDIHVTKEVSERLSSEYRH